MFGLEVINVCFTLTNKYVGVIIVRNIIYLVWILRSTYLSHPIRNLINRNYFLNRKLTFLSDLISCFEYKHFLTCSPIFLSSSALSSLPTKTVLNTPLKKPLENSKSETINLGSSLKPSLRELTIMLVMKPSTFLLDTSLETTIKRSKSKWLPQSPNKKSEKDNSSFNSSCQRAGPWIHSQNLMTQESTWEWSLKEKLLPTDTTEIGQRDTTMRKSWKPKLIWEELELKPKENQSGEDTTLLWPQHS